MSVEADGPVSSDPGFQADLDAEVEDYEADLEDLIGYPVLSMGLSFRLGGATAHASRHPPH